MILAKGGASEPPNIGLPGKAGGAVAVRRTLASTICRMTIPTQVSRPRQLRDASTVMRLRPVHQSMINRRFNDRASCPARKSPKPALLASHQFIRLHLAKADMRALRRKHMIHRRPWRRIERARAEVIERQHPKGQGAICRFASTRDRKFEPCSLHRRVVKRTIILCSAAPTGEDDPI